MAVDGGREMDVVHRMNEEYEMQEALENEQSNRG